MANNILNIKDSIQHEDFIISQQFHTYAPYTTSFDNNDEVRITIQSQDLFVLPSYSYLYIDFTTSPHESAKDGEAAEFAYNFTAFSEMRYELNGIEIDRNKSPGITSTMKCLIACKSEDERSYALFNENSGKTVDVGTYRMLLPLRFLFGFCDDFRKVVMNCKHELILTRCRTNECAYQAATDIVKFSINKIQWKIPHVALSDAAKLSMLKIISKNDSLYIPFPVLPTTNRHT